MEKENNEKLRTLYTQKIVEKEQQIDGLSSVERKLMEVFDSLESKIIRDTQRLQNLNKEMIQGGDREARWIQDDLVNRQNKFQQYSQQRRQEFRQQCIRDTARLNEERELIYKERNQLPWD